MGVKDSFSGASTLLKVAFLLTLLANFCSWMAFTTTSWIQVESVIETIHIGLWRYCSDLFPGGCSMMDGHGNAKFNAVQAFAIFGFTALNAGFFLLTLFIFWGSCKGNSEVNLASGILMILSGACWLIAVIIFVAEFDKKGSDLHFSFALAIIAALIAVISGILIFVARGGITVSST